MTETGGQNLLQEKYIKILEDMCYSQVNENKLKNLTILKNLYMLNPSFVKPLIQTRDLHLVQAIETLILQQGGMQSERAMVPSQNEHVFDSNQLEQIQNAKYNAPNSQRNDQTFRGEIAQPNSYNEGSGYDQYYGNEEDYDDDDDDDESDFSRLFKDISDQVTNPEILEQLDTVLKSLLKVEEDEAFEYLSYINQWMLDPSMVEYTHPRGEAIASQMIKYLQKLSQQGIDLERKDHYDLAISIISIYSSKKEYMLQLSENSVFDLIDTVSLFTNFRFLISQLLLLLLGSQDLITSMDAVDPECEYLKELKEKMNGSILQVISNGDPSILTFVFFDILIKSVTEPVPEKFQVITVKCMVRVYKNTLKQIESLDIPKLFLRMNSYILELKQGEIHNDQGFQSIKMFIKGIVENKDEAEIISVLEELEEGNDFSQLLR